MSADLILPALLALFPLTVSPGPATILLASSSTSFGFRRTVPVWAGIYAIFALQTLLVGAGVAEVAFRFPALVKGFQFAGAAFLVYLAYHFFKSSAVTSGSNPPMRLGFREGAVMELLNFKALLVQATMFSLFLDPARPRTPQIVAWTLFLVLLGAFSSVIWMAAGELLGRIVRSERGARWQGRVFGSALLIVALWMAFRA